MRIALVKPFDVSDSVQPVLGLGYLAAALSPDHDVTIVDAVRDRLDDAALVARLVVSAPRLVGLQAQSFGLGRVAATLEAIRRALPAATLVIGGPHPTALPVETLARLAPPIDYVFEGEAEDGLRALADRLEDGPADDAGLATVAGLVWRDRTGTVHRNPRATTDLARLPMPRWDLMDPRTYPPSPHAAFYRRFPIAPIVASRGCPHPCTFCAGSLVHGRRVRYRPLDHVIHEIEVLQRDFGVREVHFVDDNLTEDPDYVRALCDRLRSLARPIAWACPNGVRIDRIDEALARHMKAAGCHAVGLGVESGSPRVLGHIRKHLTLEQIHACADALRRAGIQTRAFFVFGFPGETRAEMRETIDLALRLPVDLAHFMFFHPFPGTREYERLQGDPIASAAAPVDWSASTFAEVAYVPDGMTRRELKALVREAFLRFYLRPSRLGVIASGVRGPRHLWYLGRRMARWLT